MMADSLPLDARFDPYRYASLLRPIPTRAFRRSRPPPVRAPFPRRSSPPLRGYRRSRSWSSLPSTSRGRDRATSRAQASSRSAFGSVTELMPSSDTPRRMKGATEVGRSMPAALPQAATAPPAFVMAMTLARMVEPTVSTPPAQRSLSSSFGGAGELVAADDLGGAEVLQIIALLRAPGRGDRHGSRASQAARPPPSRRRPPPPSRPPGRARVRCRGAPAPSRRASPYSRRCRSPSRRQPRARRLLDQPVALDPRVFRVGAVMRLADAPAVEDHLVARLEVRAVRRRPPRRKNRCRGSSASAARPAACR